MTAEPRAAPDAGHWQRFRDLLLIGRPAQVSFSFGVGRVVIEPNHNGRPSLRELLTRFVVKLVIVAIVFGAVLGALAAWWASLMGGFSGGK